MCEWALVAVNGSNESDWPNLNGAPQRQFRVHDDHCSADMHSSRRIVHALTCPFFCACCLSRVCVRVACVSGSRRAGRVQFGAALSCCSRCGVISNRSAPEPVPVGQQNRVRGNKRARRDKSKLLRDCGAHKVLYRLE